MHTTRPRSSRRGSEATLPIRNRPQSHLILGNYRLLCMLASGGMSAVYLAEDRAGRRFALKVLDAAFSQSADIIERLVAEREVSRRVHHPGLIRIDECIQPPGQLPYLVMELIDGETLGEVPAQSLRLGAISSIAAQLADALAALHVAGIVHCDVKPDNVMVTYECGLGGWPRVKLGDFGVARFEPHTAVDVVSGTPAYMAPEQWRGEVEPRTDVYGLGCLMYELITGRMPFEGTVQELAGAHLDQLPPRLATLRPATPPAFDRLVMRMLSKDASLRPSAGELAGRLAELAFALPPSATTSVPQVARVASGSARSR